MTTLVVVRNAGGYVVAFGPSDGTYEPGLPDGCTVEVEEDPDLTFPPATIEERVAVRLADRGLTLETEWQLYGSIAGTLALGALQGKNQATLYAENTGFRNAMNMYTDILFIRSGA